MINALAQHSDAVLNAVPAVAAFYLIVYLARRMLRLHASRKRS